MSKLDCKKKFIDEDEDVCYCFILKNCYRFDVLLILKFFLDYIEGYRFVLE